MALLFKEIQEKTQCTRAEARVAAAAYRSFVKQARKSKDYSASLDAKRPQEAYDLLISGGWIHVRDGCCYLYPLKESVPVSRPRTASRAISPQSSNPDYVVSKEPLSIEDRTCLASYSDTVTSYAQLVFAHDRLNAIQPLNSAYKILKDQSRIAHSAYGSILGWLNPFVVKAHESERLVLQGLCHKPSACIKSHLALGYANDWLVTQHHASIFEQIRKTYAIDGNKPLGCVTLVLPPLGLLHDVIMNGLAADIGLLNSAKWLNQLLNFTILQIRLGAPTLAEKSFKLFEDAMPAERPKPKLRLIRGGAA